MFSRSYSTGIPAVTIILIVAAAVFYLIVGARILKKGGEAGWKIIVPIYGSYCLYKVANSEGIFWGTFAVSAAASIISGIIAGTQQRSSFYYYEPQTPTAQIVVMGIAGIVLLVMECIFVKRLSEAFGKGTGFAVGLFLLAPIFFPILAFGSAQYVGAQGGLNSVKSDTGTWKCPSCGEENPNSRGTCSRCGGRKP